MQDATITPKSQVPLKYAIKVLLRQLSVEDHQEVVTRIKYRLNLSPSQYHRIISLPFDSVSEAKPGQLLVFAEELNCTIDDLINKTPQP